MKKILKFLMWIFVAFIGITILLLVTSPLWLGPVSASIANKVVPDITGTPFNIAKLEINPFSGSLSLEGLRLGNPEGYDAKNAFSVGRFSVSIRPGALLENKLHVKNVEVIDVYASYLGKSGTNNFDAILANVKTNLDPAEDKVKEEPAPEEKKVQDGPKEEMKVLIDRFHVKGVKFKMGMMPELPIPFAVTLTELGTKNAKGEASDGLTVKEMGLVLSAKLSEAFSKAGGNLMKLFNADAFKSLEDSVSNFGGEVTNAVGSAASAIKNIGGSTTKQVGDATRSVGKGVSDAVGKTANVATEAASKATDAATDAVKSVGEGAKGLLKGAGSLFGGDKGKKK